MARSESEGGDCSKNSGTESGEVDSTVAVVIVVVVVVVVGVLSSGALCGGARGSVDLLLCETRVKKLLLNLFISQIAEKTFLDDILLLIVQVEIGKLRQLENDVNDLGGELEVIISIVSVVGITIALSPPFDL